MHTLDGDEITHWLERVEVGNAYVNRHTTGAIVRRQPFGGWKHSSVGPGAKTGGPHDILRFVRFEPTPASLGRPLDIGALAPRDATGLHAEANELRYRRLAKVAVRTTSTTGDDERRVLSEAAGLTGVAVEFADATESDDALARRIGESGAQRLRVLGPINDALARACHAAAIAIDDTAVTGVPRVELARWTREQAISRTLHRHGRVAPAWSCP